jgi:predicted MPP superfamily phosphohydrolase
MLRSSFSIHSAGMSPLDSVPPGEPNRNVVANGRLGGRRLVRLSRRGFLQGGVGLVGLSGASTAAYAAAIEPGRLVTTTYRITPPGWQAPRLRVAVIADPHAGGPNMALPHIRRIVDEANALAPDLIVLLGDYVATHRFVTERVPYAVWAAEYARLAAPLGVHAILGNHDWWYDVNGVRQAFAKVGIPVLENRAVRLGAGARRFWLAGLGDQLAYRLGPHNFRGVDDLPGTLAQVTTDDPVILLAHEPDIFPDVPDRVALTLSGHTHGGQIRIPGLWERFVPSKYGTRFAYGHIVEDGRHMVVSGGLGTSFAPIRLGVPPEIVHMVIGA